MLQVTEQVASTATKKLLNNQADEPEQLAFHPHAKCEITFNDPNGNFFHTQQAMLLDKLPDAEQLNNWQPIELHVSPPGWKHEVDETITEDELLRLGWKKCMIGINAHNEHHIGFHGLVAKRVQCGLRPHMTCTMHGLQGKTLSSVATKLDTPFDIWERGQVIVFISRVEHGKDTHFIGDKQMTIQCLMNALRTKTQFDDYVEHIIVQMMHKDNSNTAHDFMINVVQHHPFRPIDTQLPGKGFWVSYIAFSLKEQEITKIGSTQDIGNRINQINTGKGARATRSDFAMPFALLGCVAGFNTNKQHCQSFERAWFKRVNMIHHKRAGQLSLHHKMEVGKELVANWNAIHKQEQLHFMECGKIV